MSGFGAILGERFWWATVLMGDFRAAVLVGDFKTAVLVSGGFGGRF